MVSDKSKPSIHELEPLESGGVIARSGFVFQDHVAASFLIDMLKTPALQEVWCETQDDITLIWLCDSHQEVEFIQVKNVELGHPWSAAELCKRERMIANAPKMGTSILEKSLAHDCCAEPCRFRMVTSLSVNSELKILTLYLESPSRQSQNKNFSTLCQQVKQKVPDAISQNGHDSSWWLSNVLWDIRHSDDAVERKNIEDLGNFTSEIGGFLSPEQIRQKVYPQLLVKIQQAASAKWENNPDAKKIRRNEFIEWLKEAVSNAQYPSSGSAGEKMQKKMEEAHIAPDYIITAHEERRHYRQEILNPRYLDFSDRNLIEGEVLAELEQLRIKLDNGEISEGFPFYGICLERMGIIRTSLSTESQPPLFFVSGCMHDITDRCGHRYIRCHYENVTKS
jgi:hypothetical protein